MFNCVQINRGNKRERVNVRFGKRIETFIFFASLNRHGLLFYRRFDLPAIVFKPAVWIGRITITEIHVRTRAFIHTSRTCYILNSNEEDQQNRRNQPGMRPRKGGRPPWSRHFWLPLLPRLPSVSHAVVSSYIPEIIIRRESTSTCRRAQNRDDASPQIALIVSATRKVQPT